MLDVPTLQNRLSDIAQRSHRIPQRIEQAQGCLGLGDDMFVREIELAIEASKQATNELISVKNTYLVPTT